MSGLDRVEPEQRSAAPQGAPTVRPAAAGLGHRQILALQRTAGNAAVNRLLRTASDRPPTAAVPAATLPAATNLPPLLRVAVERLSRQPMDGVTVHYDSAEPDAIGAHAFARGDDIHLAPGAEGELPHEAWHVAQQRAGRVSTTISTAGGEAVNDSKALEAEADRMGTAARREATRSDPTASPPVRRRPKRAPIIQGSWVDGPAMKGPDPITAFFNWVETTPVLTEMLPEHVDAIKGLAVESSANADARRRFLAFLQTSHGDGRMWSTPRLIREGIAVASTGGAIGWLYAQLDGLLPSARAPYEGAYSLLTMLATPTSENATLRTAVGDALSQLAGTTPIVGRIAAATAAAKDAHDLQGADEDHDDDPDGPPRDGVAITFDNFDTYLNMAELPIGDQGLYQVFLGLATSEGLFGTPEIYRTWYTRFGVHTRAGFRALFDPPATTATGGGTAARSMLRRARTPGTLSYQDEYDTYHHGTFENVTYKLDSTGGNINFAKAHAKKAWANPVKSGSTVQLKQGGKGGHGLMNSGRVIPIVGGRRREHFSMANRIMGYDGDRSPDTYTWHHLSTSYEMVLVDRRVHQKHGHNGGVHLWR